MKEKHPLDEHFRKMLESHKIEPRPSVWEKIETHFAVQQGRNNNMYMLRAAVVILLIGLSGVFYYQNNNMISTLGPGTDEKKDGITTDKDLKGADKKPKGYKSGESQKEKAKSDKVVPIMRQKIGSQPTIIVSHETLPDIVEETLLAADEPFVLQTLVLDQENEETRPTIKIRVKVKKPITSPAFYAETNTSETGEKMDLKDKLYSYAGNQLENVINGKPLEWPEKPQGEINLSKIFN